MSSFFINGSDTVSKFFSSAKTTANDYKDQLPNYFTAKKTSVSVLNQSNAYITFDAVMEDTHTGTATATKHAIEDGSTISDHIMQEPETLAMRIIVSNDVVVPQGTDVPPAVAGGIGSTRNDRASGFNGGYRGTGGGTDSTLGGFSFVGGRAEEAYAFLREVKNKGAIVSVYTTLHSYTNMYIASLSCTRNKDTGNMIEANITFSEIKIATTLTTAAPTPIAPARKPSVNKGKQVVETPTEAKQSTARKYLTKLIGGS